MKSGCIRAVLLQDHGGKLRPVFNFSAKVDPVAAGLPRCLRVVYSAENAVTASRDIGGYSDITVSSICCLHNFARAENITFPQCRLWYNIVLLLFPNMSNTALSLNLLLYFQQLKMESNIFVLPFWSGFVHHDPIWRRQLDNPDLVLFVDGSASHDLTTGCNRDLLLSRWTILRSDTLPSHYTSSQMAELLALTEACRLEGDKIVAIYTVSQYAFGIVHDFGALFKHWNFLKIWWHFKSGQTVWFTWCHNAAKVYCSV